MKTEINFKSVLIVSACAVILGCAHSAKVYKSPDHTKLTAATNDLDAAVVKLRVASAKVTTDLRVVRTAHTHEKELLKSFDTPLSDLALVAPAALLPQINAIQADVAALKQSQADTEAKLSAFEEDQKHVDEIAAKADEARKLVEKYTPEFQRDVDKVAAKLNEAEQAWAKDSAEIVHLRMGSIFTKILACLGALLFIVVAGGAIFLWWTGRMAKVGAAVLR